MKVAISLTVNGQPYEVSVEPRKTLLSVLREQLHLTGTILELPGLPLGA